MYKIKSERGFTLIELIIVVAILGVLSALIIPRITGNVNDAKKATDYANALNIAKQIELAFANGDLTVKELDNRYSKNISQIFILEEDTGLGGILEEKGYLDKIPFIQSESKDDGIHFAVKLVVEDNKIVSLKISNSKYSPEGTLDGDTTYYPK